MNYGLPGEESVGKVVKRSENEEDFNFGSNRSLGMVIRAHHKGVRYLSFVTSISPVTVVDINISGVLSRFLAMSVVAIKFQTNWALFRRTACQPCTVVQDFQTLRFSNGV